MPLGHLSMYSLYTNGLVWSSLGYLIGRRLHSLMLRPALDLLTDSVRHVTQMLMACMDHIPCLTCADDGLRCSTLTGSIHLVLEHAIHQEGDAAIRFNNVNRSAITVLVTQLDLLRTQSECASGCCAALVTLFILSTRPECHFPAAFSCRQMRCDAHHIMPVRLHQR